LKRKNRRHFNNPAMRNVPPVPDESPSNPPVVENAGWFESPLLSGIRLARCAVLGVVCSLVVGIYAWRANSGMLELLGSGPQDSYYNLLIQGFRAGQLNVNREMPPGLARGPLDRSVDWDIVGKPLHDLSYYNGKLYLYFGVTPALVLFWPYEALTGHYLLHKDAVVIFLSVGFLAGTGLLLAAWRRYFAGVSFWVVVAGVLALGLANFTPAMLGRCDVYEVAISCRYALMMLSLAGIWGALHGSRRRVLWLALASLAYGLAVGARPSFLLGAVVLLVPVFQAWRERRAGLVESGNGGRSRMWPLFLAATGPIVLIGIGLMLYNYLRFDNPLEFGQQYQLPVSIHHQFSLRYFWFNFQVAFLEPAHWTGYFPFVDRITAPPLPAGASIDNHPFGVLTNIPLVWLALAAPLAWRNRLAEARILRWFLMAAALLFGICVLTLCLHDSMCLRYEVEFTDTLMLLVAIGILALEGALAGRPLWRWAARCGWGLLLIFSVAFNLLASFVLQAETCNNFGFFLLQQGHTDQAILQFRKALAISPGYEEDQYDLGVAMFQKGRVDEAISNFQKALAIWPDDAEAHISLGDALLLKGRTDEAILHYQRALVINPGGSRARYDLGDALLQKGQLDDAILQFQKALAVEPDNADALGNLGAALLQKGRVDEAILEFQKVVVINPGNADARDNLGAALLNAGRLDEALAQFQRALALQPGNVDVGGNLSLVLFKLGRTEEAIAAARRALQLAVAQTNAAQAGYLQKQIETYQSGVPFRGQSLTNAPP